MVVNDDGGSIFSMLEQGDAGVRRRVRGGSSAPRTASTSRACARPPAPRTGGSTPSPSSSTRWPARTAASRSSRPGSAATTAASSTPGSGRWPRPDRPSARMRAWRPQPSWSRSASACWPAWRSRAGSTSRAPLFLVVAGFAASYLPGVPEVRPASPRWCCSACCRRCCTPPRSRTSLVDFNANRRPILLLSVGLVVFTTVGVAVLVHALLPSCRLAARRSRSGRWSRHRTRWRRPRSGVGSGCPGGS